MIPRVHQRHEASDTVYALSLAAVAVVVAASGTVVAGRVDCTSVGGELHHTCREEQDLLTSVPRTAHPAASVGRRPGLEAGLLASEGLSSQEEHHPPEPSCGT